MAKEEADGLDVWDVALLLGGGALGAVGGRKLARAFMSKKFLEKAKAAKGSYWKVREPEETVTGVIPSSRTPFGKGFRPAKKMTTPDRAAQQRNKRLDDQAEPYGEYLRYVVPVAGNSAILAGTGAVAAKRSVDRKRK